MLIKKNVFYPQLDSLRAIAIILVIISHWFAHDNILNRYTNNGVLGVTLFFVLSGFLITSILLNNRIQIEQGYSIKKAFYYFYIRRSLRIFPIYYLTLIILVVLNIANIQKSFGWHFFYGSNFYFWLQEKFGGSLSHFWSLAVEEQFYLFWPAIIFFIPFKYLQQTFVMGIFTAMAFRYTFTTPGHDIGRILMPGSLDSFCIGGLFAFGKLYITPWYRWYLKYNRFWSLSAVIILIIIHTQIFRDLNFYWQICLSLFLLSISFAIIIANVANRIQVQPLKLILDNKLLLYIGKISYGLYLFHNFIPFLYGIKLPKILIPFSYYIIQFVRFGLLFGISSFSWFLIEKPFLRFKRYFIFP